jgi:ubiquinone/menaquinone biosynthesis C-methylase UbiE
VPLVEQLAAEYSAKASAYDQFWAPVLRPFALPLLDALPLGGSRRVLDLGAGTGYLAHSIRARAPHSAIVLADCAVGMLQLAPTETWTSRVAVDAQDLAFAAGVFDVAVLAFVLFHVPDPRAALREVRRVLRPGGVIGITTWSEVEAMPAFDLWTQELDAAGAATVPRDPRMIQDALMDTPDKLAALLSESGFVDVRATQARFEHRFTPATLLDVQVGVCGAGRRLRTMTPEGAATCQARVAARLQQLSDEELAFRPDVNWGFATAPDSRLHPSAHT